MHGLMLGGRPRVFEQVSSATCQSAICLSACWKFKICAGTKAHRPQQRGLPACIKQRALCQWEYYAPLHCRIQTLKYDSGHLQYANTLSVG